MPRRPFPLFQSHLDLAHTYWQRLLHSGDTVIDATVGNGHDTLFLARTLFEKDYSGTLIGIDIQSHAIAATRQLLEAHIPQSSLPHIHLFQQCHSSFPKIVKPNSVALIVYNLGYLPGGDKQKITQQNTTLQSLAEALPLIKQSGAISITCYPGHPGGKEEEESVMAFAAALDKAEWSCCHHRLINRWEAPSLLLIQRVERLDP